MPNKDIPSEAQAMIDDFNAEQSSRAKGTKSERPAKKHRRLLESLQSGKVFTPKELISFALSSGWSEIDGGSHRKFIHLDGRTLTIPHSGGQQKTIEPDTAHRILEQIFPDLF